LLGDTVKDGDEVTFTSVDPTLYPLPDHRYLALHAAVAKVVHMAGIGEYLDGVVEKFCLLSDNSCVDYYNILRIAQRNALVW